MGKILILLLIVFILAPNIAIGTIIPDSRRITWDAGVRGGIPTRTTIYTTLTANGSNDTSQIQTALNNCPVGQVVKLSSANGSFKISSQLTIKKGITLRGDGIALTIIQGLAGFTSDQLVYINNGFSFGTERTLTSSALTKGSSTINTSGAHGWSAGDYVWIDELQNPTGDPPVTMNGGFGDCTWCGRSSGRVVGQWVQIKTVPTSTSATISPVLYWPFSTSRSAVGVKGNNMVDGAGIEDLKLDNQTSHATNVITIYGAVNCWAKSVDMAYAGDRTVQIFDTFWLEFRKCTIHHGWDGYGNSRAYGLHFYSCNTATLMEDNILYTLRLPIAFEGSNSGHVVGYNYFTALANDTAGWATQSMGFHGSCPIFVLIEGNYTNGGFFKLDQYWGNTLYNTLLRNRFIPVVTGIQYGDWGIEAQTNCRYMNVVGNILGTLGYEHYYQFNGQSGLPYDSSPIGSGSAMPVYRLGYNDGSGNEPTNHGDDAVATTMIRHGNWDSYNNGIVWDAGISDHVIPNSYYYASKPSWWDDQGSGRPWPPIGSDLSPTVTDIPAKDRYEGGKTILQAPKNLRVTGP